jgi:transposase
LITDAAGVPLIVRTSPANLNDGVPAIQLLDSIPPIQGPRGRPCFRPAVFMGDRAYGSAENIAATRARGIYSAIAPINSGAGSGLGVFRYVVERTLSWFSNFRRLKLCYEKAGSRFQAFRDLAAALICANELARPNPEI